ncbi:MAG: class I SAM-dependent methyltransferase [archaeon]
MNRFQQFSKIKAAFDKIDQEFLKNGSLPMRDTEDGFWGSSNMNLVYDFFVKVGLEKYRNFLDLGSGDGRIVLIASLFTKATGVESDKELLLKGAQARDNLGLNAEFIHRNYLDIDWSKYDFIFIFPDKRFKPALEKKLKEELKGKLFVYNNVYVPYFLKKGKTWWIDQMPLVEFTK